MAETVFTCKEVKEFANKQGSRFLAAANTKFSWFFKYFFMRYCP